MHKVRLLLRALASLATFLLLAVVLSGIYGWFFGGPWLSFDGPEIVDTRAEAIRAAALVPGEAWPGTRIEVKDLPDGSLVVERIWLGLSEAELVVARQGDYYAVPVDGLTGLTYGPGATVKETLFLIPAFLAAAIVYLLIRRRQLRMTGSQSDAPSTRPQRRGVRRQGAA